MGTSRNNNNNFYYHHEFTFVKHSLLKPAVTAATSAANPLLTVAKSVYSFVQGGIAGACGATFVYPIDLGALLPPPGSIRISRLASNPADSLLFIRSCTVKTRYAERAGTLAELSILSPLIQPISLFSPSGHCLPAV